jgi:hypothetical protein
VANYLWLLNDGSSRILLNNGTDKLALNEEVVEQAYGWQQPPSEPRANYTKSIASRAVVAALAGCILTPIAYPGTGDALASTITTSVRHDKTIIYDELAYTPRPQANDAIGWHQPFSLPRKAKRPPEYPAFVFTYAPVEAGNFVETNTTVRFRKTIIYDDVGYSPYVEAAEVITLDKWFAEVEQPTRRKLGAAEGTFAFVGDNADRFAWRQPLSEPVRRKTFREGAAVIAPIQPQASDTVAGWHRPFSDPTRRVTTRQQQELAFAGKPADPVYWYPRLSEPTRIKVRQNEGSFVYPYQTIVTGAPGDGAYLPAAISTSLRHDRTIIFDDYAQAPYTPAAEAPTEIAGAGSNTVVRSRKTIIYDDVIYSPYVQTVEVVTSDKWFAPLSQPTRRKVFLEGDVAHSPTLVEDAAIQAKWFQPFGVPRAAKRVPEFPAYSYSPYFVPPESGVGVEFNWWPNLSERIRRHSLKADRQQFLIQGPQNPVTVTLEYAWHRPLSEPTRRKDDYSSYDLRYAPYIEPEVVTLDKWFKELERPTRRKTFREGTISLAPFQVIGPDSWWRQFDKPVLGKPRLEGEYTLAPFPQVSGPDRWWQAFTTPLRRKVSAAYHPEPVQPNLVPAPSYGWYATLSEPTRRIVFRTLYRPNFGVEIDFTPSDVACSHTTLLFPTATVTVTFGTSETTELTPLTETAVLYPESETEVDWPTSTTSITECED